MRSGTNRIHRLELHLRHLSSDEHPLSAIYPLDNHVRGPYLLDVSRKHRKHPAHSTVRQNSESKGRPASDGQAKIGARLETVLSLLATVISILALLLAYFTSPFSDVLVPRLEYSIGSDALPSKIDPGLITGFSTKLKISNVSRVAAQEVSVEFVHDNNATVTISAEGPVQHDAITNTPGRRVIRISSFPPHAGLLLRAEIAFNEPAKATDTDELRFFNGFGNVYHQHGAGILVNK